MPYIIDTNTADELGLPPGTRFEQGAGRVTRRGVWMIRFILDTKIIEIDCAKVMWANHLGGRLRPLVSPFDEALRQQPRLPPPVASEAELIIGIPAPIWTSRKGRYQLNSVDDDPDAYRDAAEMDL
jgi:hypothetical protein